MGVSLADLVNDKRTIPVECAGRIINVSYRPNSLNARFYQEQTERREARQAEGRIMPDYEWAAWWFSRVVCGWDVTDGDHEAPINDETLGVLGTRFLLNAVEAISEDILPSPTSSASSPNGSAQPG